MQIDTLCVGALQTNCYLLYDENTRQALIVDPGDEAARIIRAVEERSLQVTAVVLTHVHFDHMLACEAVCQTFSAPLYVGHADEAALTDEKLNLVRYFSPDRSISLTADRLLHEGDELMLGTERLVVMETPGHTPGSICLQSDDILISGDTLFRGSVGRTDFPRGDMMQLRRSLDRLMAIGGDRRVYAGHDAPTTLSYERQTNPYIVEESSCNCY